MHAHIFRFILKSNALYINGNVIVNYFDYYFDISIISLSPITHLNPLALLFLLRRLWQCCNTVKDTVGGSTA